ncbi:rhodanese-related sulfurtransferase [Synechococcus sp. CBW1004]|nr:rhodanese-related sulfurtransferase [Synechococcus sp. CBW1004]
MTPLPQETDAARAATAEPAPRRHSVEAGDAAVAATSLNRPAELAPALTSVPGEAAAEATPPLRVAAFYRFAAMEELVPLRLELLELAATQRVQGTILLADEGVNGTICGPDTGVMAVLSRLRRCPGLEPLEAKFSRAPQQAFQRLKVRLKREIVTMGCPTVNPSEQVGTYVPPDRWDALIDDPDTLVIDTRNHYEVAIGSFQGAIDPGTDSFREFPQWVERELRPLVAERRPRAIAMFCTGGIRCEKATAYLLQQGFRDVHHLHGGILRYLEEHPEAGSRWQGECFVFDQRVAVNHRLEPGEHRLCHACGLPLAPADLKHPGYREGVSCHQCLDRFSDADRERFAERQRQIEQSRKRGEVHVGAVMPQRPVRPCSHRDDAMTGAPQPAEGASGP